MAKDNFDNYDYFEDEEEQAEARTPVGAASIVVAGVFLLCLIFVFAKVLFTSNSDTVPQGLDTATINTNITEPEEEPAVTGETVSGASFVPADSNAGIVVGDGPADPLTSGAEMMTSMADSSQTQGMGTMYVTEYAYLHTAPSEEAENIVCMSPGIAVTVLSQDPSGYYKVTFVNIDEPLTGYVHKDYLSETQTVVPEWEQW